MPVTDSKLTTGLPGLDRVLKGLMLGDNIVWQVDTVDDYRELVTPYYQAAVAAGHKTIYFRFAEHAPLVPAGAGVDIREFDPEDGFETFILHLYNVIAEAGHGAFYVFDCLSELAVTWHSDQMLGNFFRLTCPNLFDMETIAYFALQRNYHSPYAVQPILDTTQLFLDVFRHQGEFYIRPLKVQQRYSPTMNMLHARRGDDFVPVSASYLISEIMTSAQWSGLPADRRPDFWAQAFIEAQTALAEIHRGLRPATEIPAYFERLARMVITRDSNILPLVARYLTLEDIFEVRRRMIGTGLIGGKSVGMLLSRAMLKKNNPHFQQRLEEHDSFFVGADVFNTYLVSNGIWALRQKTRHPEDYLEGSVRARRRMLTGTFPEEIMAQFEEMLDYFGQAPFIVRSSSLLEDNFGNAFAGKYASVFCANQGPRHRRLEDFLAAVRTIYASTMSEEALRYRARWHLLDRDEQMALLIMRVSGAMHGALFYPHVAGVGLSFNPYVWSPDIDPTAGVVRLVFGLGTRAVDRSDDDYTRIVALNAPQRRPESNFDEVRQYAQRRVDYIELESDRLVSGDFHEITRDEKDLPWDLLCSEDAGVTDTQGRPVRILTFARLLAETEFVQDLRLMLATLQQAYNFPVDIEFSANFLPDNRYKINLLQCRPLQVHGSRALKASTVNVAPADRILEASGAVIGSSRSVNIDTLVYIVPEVYGQMPVRDRYEVARLLGTVNQELKNDVSGNIMMLGPGRWGTSSPALGIPVSFYDVNAALVICEIVTMHKNLVPDVSLGTHFLNELVELDMLYLAVFPGQRNSYLDNDFFLGAPNRLLEMIPAAAKWEKVVKVIRTADLPEGRNRVQLTADALEQKVLCYFDRFGATMG